MPDGQNIIDLGYDVDKLTAQQKVVVACLNEVFQLSENLDGRKIAPDITGIQDFNRAQATSKKAMDDIGLAVKEYNKVLSDMAVTQAKQNAATSTAAENLAKEKAVLQATNAELKANAQLQNAVAGSIEEAVAKIKVLTLERNKLNLTTDEGKKRQEEINLKIDNANILIQNHSSALEKQKINVGNYSSILSGYANTLRGLRGPVSLLAEALGMSAFQANQFRLVVEHSLQGIASYFRGKTEAAGASKVWVSATTSATVATTTFDSALQTSTVTTLENTVVSEANTAAKEGETAAIDATAVALESEAVAAEGAEVATGGLLATLMPFLAVIAIAAVPIFLLVDAVKSWINADENALKAEKDLAESLEKSIALEKEAVETIKAKNEAQLKGAKEELALAEKAGASKDELLEKGKKIAQQELENAKKIKDSKGISDETVAAALAKEQKYQEALSRLQKRWNRIQEVDKDNSSKTYLSRQDKEDADKLKARIDTFESQHKYAKSDYDFQKGILDDFSKAQQAAAEKGIEITRHETEETNKLELQRLTDASEITKAKNAIILTDDKATLSQKLAALKGNNEAEKKVLEEGLRQKLTSAGARGSDGKYTKETLAEIEKVNTAKQVLDIKYFDDDRKIKLAFHNRDLEALKVYNETLLNETIESNKRIISSDVFSLEERTAALEDNASKQAEIINNEYQRQLELKGFAGKDITKLDKTQKHELEAIEVEHNAKLKALGIQSESELITIQLSTYEKLKKDAEEYYKDAGKDAELANSIQVLNTQIKYSEEKKALNDKFLAGTLGLKKYNAETKKLEDEAALQSLKDLQANIQAQIATEKIGLDNSVKSQEDLNSQIADLKANGKGADGSLDDQQKIELDSLNKKLHAEETAQKDHQIKMNNLDAQYAKNAEQIDKYKIAAKKAFKAQELELTKQLVNESVTLLKTLVDAGYENELNALRKVKDQTDENYSTELKNIESSTLSQQDKAARTVQLQAEQKARDKELEREQREIKNRQAKADRAFAIAAVVENTAMGIASVLSTGGGTHYADFGVSASLLVALVSSIGAAQIAAILSKPIPQYAEGTDYHPGGLAIVGEGKYKENVTLPSGESFIADKPMLLNLPMGTSVDPISSDAIETMMSNAMFHRTSKMVLLTEQRENRRNDKLEAVMKENNQLLKKIAERDTINKVVVSSKYDPAFERYIDIQVRGKA